MECCRLFRPPKPDISGPPSKAEILPHQRGNLHQSERVSSGNIPVITPIGRKSAAARPPQNKKIMRTKTNWIPHPARPQQGAELDCRHKGINSCQGLIAPAAGLAHSPGWHGPRSADPVDIGSPACATAPAEAWAGVRRAGAAFQRGAAGSIEVGQGDEGLPCFPPICVVGPH